MSDVVLTRRDPEVRSVAVVTLNRPEQMNRFTVEVFQSLLNTVNELGHDKSVRVVVMTGAGKAFCAGADISEAFANVAVEQSLEHIDGVQRDIGGVLNLAIAKLDTPVIAAINGSAVGLGMTMTLPCDIRIAARKAKYGIPVVRRGIVAEGVASFYLPQLVGFSKASQWLLSGQYIDPEDGLRSSLFNALHDNEEVLPAAMAIARDMAVNCSPEAVSQTKRLLRETLLGHGAMQGAPFMAHMRESELLLKAFVSSDCDEGVRAFLEKRAPKFQDRQS